MLLLRWCGLTLLVGMVIFLTFNNLSQISNLWLTLAMGVFGTGFLVYSDYHLQAQNRQPIFTDILECVLDMLDIGCDILNGIVEFLGAL